jgi:hypothetical protein
MSQETPTYVKMETPELPCQIHDREAYELANVIPNFCIGCQEQIAISMKNSSETAYRIQISVELLFFHKK